MCADVNIFYQRELLFKTYDKPSYAKGQLISKAIFGVLDSPKKRTKKI